MESFSEEAAGKLAALLNAHLCGLSADKITLPLIIQIEKAMGEDGFLVNAAVKCIYDVMSELDEFRQDYILNHIRDWQVFLTCCDRNSVGLMKQGAVFRMEKGLLVKEG